MDNILLFPLQNQNPNAVSGYLYLSDTGGQLTVCLYFITGTPNFFQLPASLHWIYYSTFNRIFCGQYNPDINVINMNWNIWSLSIKVWSLCERSTTVEVRAGGGG